MRCYHRFVLAISLTGLLLGCPGSQSSLPNAAPAADRAQKREAEICPPEVYQAVLDRLYRRYYPISTCDTETTRAQLACWNADIKEVRKWAATLKSACIAGQYNEWLDYYSTRVEDCRKAVASKQPVESYELELQRKAAAQAAWEARHPIPAPPVASPCGQEGE